jgi:polar amino acid transport system ATP-binding protein
MNLPVPECAPGFFELAALRKQYGRVEVLKHIDLTIAKGERVCIVGPSGSGKSTLLRCAAMLVEPSAGSLSFKGELVETWPKRGRAQRKLSAAAGQYLSKISMVFQHFELFPHLTALQNVTLAPRHVLKVPKDEAIEQGLDLLDRVGLRQFADSHPARLSGGQQQRVAIARALATSPEIVFFDEPTSALDPEMVGEVLAIMTDLARGGITMVVVTHETRFARDLADRVIVMEGGLIIESGTPDNVFESPRSPRTRQFLKVRSGAGVDGYPFGDDHPVRLDGDG